MGTFASELGPHVERTSALPRVYVDANVPAGLVDRMRHRLHWDVLFVIEDDRLRRAADIEHFRLARQLRRTLITLDRDYLDDRRFPVRESGGVLVLTAPDERGLAVLLDRVDRTYFHDDAGAVVVRLPLDGRKVHVHPDWRLDSSRRRA
jgi:predicted nuclease of predicted toxin-antitoxin system